MSGGPQRASRQRDWSVERSPVEIPTHWGTRQDLPQLQAVHLLELGAHVPLTCFALFPQRHDLVIGRGPFSLGARLFAAGGGGGR